jgi:iodotyrosine deiodinase
MAERIETYVPEALAMRRLPPEEAEARSEEFVALMRERRSVRHFSPEPVPRALLENALKVAASAPSGANKGTVAIRGRREP